MSDEAKNIPQDDDKFKDMVGKFFGDSPEPAKPKPVIKKVKGSSEQPKETSEMIDYATEKALEELELLRLAFLDFQEQIASLVVYQYLTPQIEYLGEQCLDMAELIQNEIDQAKLSSEGKEKFNELQRLRARILASVYQKYRNQQGGN